MIEKHPEDEYGLLHPVIVKLNEVIEAINIERRNREWLEETGAIPHRTAPWPATADEGAE